MLETQASHMMACNCINQLHSAQHVSPSNSPRSLSGHANHARPHTMRACAVQGRHDACPSATKVHHLSRAFHQGHQRPLRNACCSQTGCQLKPEARVHEEERDNRRAQVGMLRTGRVRFCLRTAVAMDWGA